MGSSTVALTTGQHYHAACDCTPNYISVLIKHHQQVCHHDYAHVLMLVKLGGFGTVDGSIDRK